jgi:apolipoprotein D and lipocalin family protein
VHKLSLTLCLLLLACAQPAPQPEPRFRNPAAGIWSNAQFDSRRFLGRWKQVASFGPASACKPGGIEVAGKPGALTLAARLCSSGRQFAFSGPLPSVGPGRFRAADQDWWVIWVDTDYRTIAIGTPSGAYGFLLNREAALPADRLRAAREIFDFNGYDLRQLTVF